jgi:hypothetical protein
MKGKMGPEGSQVLVNAETEQVGTGTGRISDAFRLTTKSEATEQESQMV